jgi:SAM-dependent methyltransferase
MPKGGKKINDKALRLYSCVCCKAGGLELSETDEAVLRCLICGASFPIISNVPRFVEADNYANTFGFQWNIHAKDQLDSYSGQPISAKRLFAVTGWPVNMTGEVILEAGSGAGRFTEVLLGTGADIFSFDLSSAVNANQANNGHLPNLNLFQGSIFDIPFNPMSFGKVLCLGVIQHTPDPEKAFKSLAAQVRPGGELVIDVYTKSIIHSIHWKYILRPLTKRMNQETLYKIIAALVPVFLPFAIILRRVWGRVGIRLLPIVEYSHLGLTRELNERWAILDTFDMYAPAHDHPQSILTVKRWYQEAGFEDVTVQYGPNGVIAKGRRPLT